jgi:hypothetical protein
MDSSLHQLFQFLWFQQKCRRLCCTAYCVGCTFYGLDELTSFQTWDCGFDCRRENPVSFISSALVSAGHTAHSEMDVINHNWSTWALSECTNKQPSKATLHC